jgi:hypothetical protein
LFLSSLTPDPQPLAPRRASARRAISLIEVLISMFVLMIGLLGVAAMIPAGRFEVLQGAKVDHSTMVGRAAFRDLKIRGYLNPNNWNVFDSVANTLTGVGVSGVPTMANSSNNVTPCIVIDPLSLGAGTGFNNDFPNGVSTMPYMRRIVPFALATVSQQNIASVADPVFRSGDDLLFTPNSSKDFPPTQQWFKDTSSPPNNVRRLSDGNYSWLATVVTNPTSSALSSKLTVSVAVFYKRDLANPAVSESYAAVTNFVGRPANTPAIAGGEIQWTPPTGKQLKPGQWIMLAGSVPVGSGAGAYTLYYFSWYRVVAADALNTSGSQYASLAGPDWMPTAAQTQLWLIDNVIAVYEKNMKLDLQ